ncbi:unnamed protein product [Caenorhabditis angaria]|uniref:Aminopeptidase n=1 Tax=Caenorhabditis angaria TaxID=860376 RepID=A0A9P1I6R8_9PELO|nr:unnamed protein product [Caenorhabditis angaria]
MSPPPAPPAPPIHAPKKHHHNHYNIVDQHEAENDEDLSAWTPRHHIPIRKSSKTPIILISICLMLLMFLLGLSVGAFVHAVLYPEGGSPISNFIDFEENDLENNVTNGVYDEITNEKLIQINIEPQENEKEEEEEVSSSSSSEEEEEIEKSIEVSSTSASSSSSENSEEDEQSVEISSTSSSLQESDQKSQENQEFLEEHRECMNMSWVSSRLPKWFKPIEYKLRLHPNLTTNLVKSRVIIEVEAVEKTDQLILNAEELEMKRFEIRRKKKKNQVIEAEFTDCKLMTQWSWKFSKILKPGEILHLEIDYESEMKPDLQGLYISTHTLKSGAKIKSAATQFEPTFARKMLPCFDEPNFKSKFEVSIIRQAEHVARSNMPLKISREYLDTENTNENDEEKQNGPQLYEDFFEKSVKMSTYLLAVAILDNYSYVRKLTQNTKKSIEVRLYAPADIIEGQSEFGIDTTIKALEFFENYFNISYPLEKIDLLALDDFSEGAMENWGLVTFRDSALLFDETKASVVAKEHIALIICHEIAHQWFGNLVTMDWWNELYLNEGFANYMEYKCVDVIFPDWNIMTRFYAENVAFSQEPDGFLSTRAIESEDPDSLLNLFDAINYHKAAAIIHMIAEMAGQRHFQQALVEYLNEFAYGNAKGVELWSIVEKYSGTRGIKAVAEAYTKQIGYPLVNIGIEDDKIFIQNQTRFHFGAKSALKNTEDRAETWPIPMNYRILNETRFIWLHPNSSHQEIPVPNYPHEKHPPPLILNSGGVGYFKVQYDDQMYTQITHQLRQNHTQISAIDRAMILVDAFDLARAGRVTIDVWLELVRYAENEKDKMTWTIINKHLQTIESLIENSPENFQIFRDFERSLILKLYETFDWKSAKNQQTPMRKGLQIETFQAACRLNILDCSKNAMKLFVTWQNTRKIDNPEFAGIIFEEGIRQNGQGAWQQIWKSYLEATSPAEKNSIINSLASVKDVHLINKLLKFCLDGQIKINLIPRVFSSLSQHEIGRTTAWRFFKTHFEKFHKIMGSGSTLLATCIRCLAEPLSTRQDLEDLKSFLIEKNLEDEGQMKMEQSYEQVELNIQWRELNEKNLEKWLEKWNEKRLEDENEEMLKRRRRKREISRNHY